MKRERERERDVIYNRTGGAERGGIIKRKREREKRNGTRGEKTMQPAGREKREFLFVRERERNVLQEVSVFRHNRAIPSPPGLPAFPFAFLIRFPICMILYRIASFLHTGCIIQHKAQGGKGQIVSKAAYYSNGNYICYCCIR